MELPQYHLEPVRKDAEFVLYRGLPQGGAKATPASILALAPIMVHPAPATLMNIKHEFSLKNDLDSALAIRPIDVTEQQGRSMILFEDPGGTPLDQFLGQPMELGRFLRFGIALAAAISHVHSHGLIH